MNARWFAESLHPNVRQGLRVKRVLYRGRSAFQHIQILDTYQYGRALVLDGVVQTTEADEHVYHEMLTHVPLLTHPHPKRVLIIGAGDGGILREALKHPVEQATLVEIDAAVIRLSKKYLRKICADAFEDPRVRVLVDDGAKFLKTTDESFDAIVVDSPDPIGPGTVLFGRAFYEDAANRLAPQGVLARQTGASFLQPDELPDALTRMRGAFAQMHPYVAAVPTYIGGFFSFVMGTKSALILPTQEDLERRFTQLEFSTQYYSPAIHRAAFALPQRIAKQVTRELSDAQQVRR